MNWHVAVDLSGTAARLAARDERSGVVAGEASLPMRGRDAARLAPWVTERLSAWGIALDEIGYWTVGSGPGSFTGMRLAAALVTGLVYGRSEVKTRCVPTATALAAGLPMNGEKTRAVLYDGRNREILVYVMRAVGEEWEPTGRDAILNEVQARDFFARESFDGLTALEVELDAIGKIVPTETLAKVRTVGEISLTPLLRAAQPFDGDLTRLVYLRPAVFTK